MWLMDLHDEEWLLLRHQGLLGARWHLEQGGCSLQTEQWGLCEPPWAPEQFSGATSVQRLLSSCHGVLVSKDLTSNLLQQPESHISCTFSGRSEGNACAAAHKAPKGWGFIILVQVRAALSPPCWRGRLLVDRLLLSLSASDQHKQLKLHSAFPNLLIKGVSS